MTAVGPAARMGNGKILANFREIPAVCRPVAEAVVAGLKAADMNGVLVMGNTSEPVCEIPVELNRIGIVLVGGLNPVAALGESGIKVESHAMSTVVDYRQLVKFSELKL
jgi:repressor of nif and glnA expression